MASPSFKQTRRPLANPKAAIDDWLNLVDPDGAFLTVTELTAVFPHGFEPMAAEQRTELRSRAADLDDDHAERSELRRWLLATVLDWDDLLAEDQRLPAASLVRVAEQGVTIRPSQALLDVDNPNKIRVGVFLWPLGTRLERRTDINTAGDTWPASPIQRAEAWCRESGVPLALVTDDDQWALVWAPRGAPAASCRWRFADLADERILQAGFVSLLGARRFFAVGEDETLEKLFERAADAEAEITKGLGSSVRRSVELLVAAISRDDVANDNRVLAGVAPTEVYESAVTVLMRLVFLLFAEERRLLPAEDPLWAESYSVLTLRDDLRAASTRDGEDALERRSTAWYRVLATCRAVHGGANHDRLTLPAYGGSLFDPDRFPFLEGRRAPEHIVARAIDLGPAEDAATGPGRPVAIDDRTVLAILDALLNIKVRSGRSTVTQRVSYKALDVEQIGHCYEGLLDHSSVRIDALAVGLTGPEGTEPEIAIDDLEHHLAGGIDGLCDWLADKERCNKAASALAKDIEKLPVGIDLARLRVACGHNDDTVARVQPFWGLIRSDLRGLPVVLLPGSQFVTKTTTRRNMGAQYTTKALAEEIAQYALEPLVYEPGPQNEADPENWKLRPPAAILSLRICDPAVGSGAILTAAGRYLADRLIEAVGLHGPGEGKFAERLADLSAVPADEQVVLARREIVDHCLYGVDKNPVAAEMAKLSLWLTTMARERPFTFLDHAIQVGDSLLGITDLEQLRWLHLDPAERKGAARFETVSLDLRLKEANELAQRLQELSVVTVRDATEKQRLHNELRRRLANLSCVADAVVGAGINSAVHPGALIGQSLDSQMDRIRMAIDDDRPAIERAAALDVLGAISAGWLRTDLPDEIPMPWDRRCLHWPLAFPEVFLGERQSGFDAVVGNPPFLGGVALGQTFGSAYERFLKLQYPESSGFVDLAVYFHRRVSSLVTDPGRFALFGPQNLVTTANRAAGTDVLLEQGWSIDWARRRFTWPGTANLDVCVLSYARGNETGRCLLDGEVVGRISASLDSAFDASKAVRLKSSWIRYSQGTDLYGDSFVRPRAEWLPLIEREPKFEVFLRPYVNAQILCTSPTFQSDLLVADFGESELGDLEDVAMAVAEIAQTVATERANQTKQIHEYRPWLHWDKRLESYAVARSNQVVLACPNVSKHLPMAFVDSRVLLSKAVKFFPGAEGWEYGLLQSGVFIEWAFVTSGRRGNDRVNFSTRASIDTFPPPHGPKKGVRSAADTLLTTRGQVMQGRNIGLTDLLNRQDDPTCSDSDVVEIRQAQMRLDEAVIQAYGWSNDVSVERHHHETDLGVRYAIAREVRDRILTRLLVLNHERNEAEASAGLRSGGRKGATKKRSAEGNSQQGSLLL